MPKIKRPVSLAMAIIMIMIYAPLPSALAAMIPTNATTSNDSITEKRAKISTFLQRDDVIDMLIKHGIDPVEASDRVASLTDREVNLLSGQIDQLPAGGDLIGTIAVIGVIFFLVLIVLELTGVVDVFTFINSPRH